MLEVQNASKMRTAEATAAEPEFRGWLRDEIGKYADVGFTRVDFSAPLLDMGLSSFQIVRLTGEIEKRLGIELDPAGLREFASIEELCRTVLRMAEGKRSRGGSAGERVSVVVAASFTAEPLHDALAWALGKAGLDAGVRFARYNQLFQELLNPGSDVCRMAGGYAVLLLRVEDWFRYRVRDGAAEPVDEAAARGAVEEFIAAMREGAARSGARLIVALAPHSPSSVRRLGLSAALDALDAQILAAAAAEPNVEALDLRRIEEDYPQARIVDEVRDEHGHIPFTQGAFAALGLAVARRCFALAVGPAKVIVVDCDNTLWGGIVGEDGPSSVDTGGGWAAFHTFLLEQQRAGKLLCLVSKNDEADALAVFDAHPGMALRPEHVAAHRINWQPKSRNLRSLAAELNLGLDSFIFIDDSAMECAEVREALPEVTVLRVPGEAARIAPLMRRHWAFDGGAVTDEDRRRTAMIRENAARRAAESSADSYDDFLGRLELVVEVEPARAADVARLAQLTQRTNQFNARKRVRSESEMAASLREPGRHMLTVRVRDRFGDYGLVGLAGGREEAGDGELVCDVFLMSCRVLGRGVEQAMLRGLAAVAERAGLEGIAVELERTGRNGVAQIFFDSLGVEAAGADPTRIRWPAAETGTVLARALSQRDPGEARPTPEAVAAVAGGRAAAVAGLSEIAEAGAGVDRLLASIDAANTTRRPELSTEYATPRNAWEKKIAAVWRDVLRIDRVGIYDDFFALGGDSLRAAEAFARMWDMGVPDEISIQTMESPTVADLARAIADVKEGRRPALISNRFSLADEGRLAEDVRISSDRTSLRPMRRVLLTGGTGYVGAYLIHELLSQTGAEVLCLVRAATPAEGRQRIVSNLRRYGLHGDTVEARLDVVLGDLTEPGLGLPPEAFRALAARIDTIVHSAAWVNFVYPYHNLRATNVDSTETVLRLAVADAPNLVQVHFISTLGVVMSTGYSRTDPILETDPLTHADDLLNGYEQSKYASDKMVWIACRERGIPCAIYRPGMVSGLSDGTYHKLDEFLPQFLKGCLQLGSFPIISSLWQIAPVDFVSKAIVHIAKDPKNLDRAYFVLHPDARPFEEHIDWHRAFGFGVRALPFDVWKRELLSLGIERLRKNALFPFVDFIRALSDEQVFFPPTDLTYFRTAIADLAFDLPPQLELMERYTRFFLTSGFYEKLPSGPSAADLRARTRVEASASPSRPQTGGAVEGTLDESIRFDANKLNASEAYYLLWTDAPRGRSMIVRYVLHNGPVEEAKLAEVWCWYRDSAAGHDVAVRQRYPLGKAEIVNGDDVRLRIGPSGYGPERVWGQVTAGDGRTVAWDLAIEPGAGFAVERVAGMGEHELFPHYQSNGARCRIAGSITVDGAVAPVERQTASDGHYWNTKHLRAWSWGHCAQFDGGDDFLFEGVAARFNDWTQPCAWLTFIYKGEIYRSDIVDAFYNNRELEADLVGWRFTAERGDLRFVGTMSARPDEQILIVHPLPDDECLYTHVTYTGDMSVDVQRREGGRWWTVDRRAARGTAAFEVTRDQRNAAVEREFEVVRAR